MSVWFTADTHFSHRSIVEKGWRPGFASVEDMNEHLITRWNECVRPDHVVWHLGDWALGPAADRFAPLSRLHGTIHLLTGNHDPVWPGHRDAHKHQRAWLDAGFASVQQYARRRIADVSVMLSHFPYAGDHTGEDRHAEYRLPDTGMPLLHGHVHDEWSQNGRQINVGVDVWDFAPVHLDTISLLVRSLVQAAP